MNMEPYAVNQRSHEGSIVKKRHILLVARWPVGGIRTFIKYVISFYPSTNYRFSFVGMTSEGISDLRNELGESIESWVLVPNDGNEIYGLMKSVWGTVKGSDIDLIHAHGFTSLVSCFLTGLLLRRPVICTSHDVIDDNNFNGFNGMLKKAILGVTLRKCSSIHTVSHESYSKLAQLFPFVESRNVTINNGVDTNYFMKAVPEDLRKRFVLEETSIVIGFFGRFMSPKGFRFLVDAAAILKSSGCIGEFHIVCFGSGAFIREEQAQIERRGLKSIFIFAPFTSDVSGAMKGCDVIAMPSLWEACPLQPMEALSAAVPFVGSDCTGLRVVLEGTPAIIVKAGDGESLAHGIEECLAIGRVPFENFAPEAVERFDVRKTAEQIHNMYEKVLA